MGSCVLGEQDNVGIGLVLDGGRRTRAKDFTFRATVRESGRFFAAIVHAEDDGADISLVVVRGQQEARKVDHLGRLDVHRLVEIPQIRAAQEGATQVEQGPIALGERWGWFWVGWVHVGGGLELGRPENVVPFA